MPDAPDFEMESVPPVLQAKLPAGTLTLPSGSGDRRRGRKRSEALLAKVRAQKAFRSCGPQASGAGLRRAGRPAPTKGKAA